MAKIICPNAEFTGVSASVEFVNGVGETENEHLIEWFKDRGYIVEDDKTGDPEQPATDITEDKAVEAVENIAKEDKKGGKPAKK